jgi:hypothetical protein
MQYDLGYHDWQECGSHQRALGAEDPIRPDNGKHDNGYRRRVAASAIYSEQRTRTVGPHYEHRITLSDEVSSVNKVARRRAASGVGTAMRQRLK